MKHYINENGDVLVSNEKTDGDFYEIPSFHYNFSLTVINQVGLYLFSKAYYLASFEKHDTIASGIIDNLKNLGVKEEIKQYSFGEIKGLYEPFRQYDYLWITCIYGANYTKFRFNKSFILPKNYIDECKNNWDSKKIDEFINNLKTQGIIDIL